MRDPERIPRILSKIERVWAKDPDLRLMQLLANVNIIEYWIEYDPTGKEIIGPKTLDPFHLEDDKLEKKLDKELKKSG